MLGREPYETRFQGGTEIRGFNQIAKFLRHIIPQNKLYCFSEKKMLGVRCTLTKKENLLKIITINERVEEAGAATRPDILRLFGQGNFIFHQEKRSGNFEK